MIRQSVISSNIASVGYENGILEVGFLNGSVYQYYGVDRTLFINMLEAPSKGKFLHRNIKLPGYSYSRV